MQIKPIIKKKLIFGTSVGLAYKIINYALQKGLTIHTSSEYPSFNKLAKIYKREHYKNQIILKIKDDNLNKLKKRIENYFYLFDTKEIFALQLSSRLLFSDNFKIIYDYINNLKYKKIIKEVYLESYWEYSSKVLELLKNYEIDGVVTPYNLCEREIDNKLYRYLIKKKIKIISLRIFSGYSLKKYSKTFVNTTYTKYFSIMIFFKSRGVIVYTYYFEFSFFNKQ